MTQKITVINHNALKRQQERKKRKGASILCPHCLQHTFVEPVTVKADYRKTGDITDVVAYNWFAATCNFCRKPVIVLFDDNDKIEVYPNPRPEPSDTRIPKEIRADLDEAKLSYSVKAYRGCAVLARKAIQNACIEKGTSKGDLVNQINDLFKKNIITEDIKEWATDVRWIGNDAAHVNKEPVEADDAEDSLKLAESFLEILYVIPKISEESRKKRNKAEPPTGDD